MRLPRMTFLSQCFRKLEPQQDRQKERQADKHMQTHTHTDATERITTPPGGKHNDEGYFCKYEIEARHCLVQCGDAVLSDRHL